MSQLKHLEDLGLDYANAINGEALKPETIDLKTAKKNKIKLVTDATDSNDVIDAYAADLSMTLRENEQLVDDKIQLTANVNNLSEDNQRMQEALMKGDYVDGRMDELVTVIDDMEKSFGELKDKYRITETEYQNLLAQSDRLKFDNQQLLDMQAQTLAEKDNLLHDLTIERENAEKLRQENERLTSQLSATEKRLDDVKNEIEGRESEVYQELVSTKDLLAARDLRVSELKEALNETDATIAGLQEDNQDLNNRLLDYEEAYSAIETSVNSLVGRLQEQLEQAGFSFATEDYASDEFPDNYEDDMTYEDDMGHDVELDYEDDEAYIA